MQHDSPKNQHDFKKKDKCRETLAWVWVGQNPCNLTKTQKAPTWSNLDPYAHWSHCSGRMSFLTKTTPYQQRCCGVRSRSTTPDKTAGLADQSESLDSRAGKGFALPPAPSLAQNLLPTTKAAQKGTHSDIGDHSLCYSFNQTERI